ncbi:hypothetical protein J8273_3485 [Carpediemonas membranifera]|uniref:Uncharacterized protein n=1 Tax=Carpediemonas membranifera TaxID=201153 RepID=A0A8J6AV82_9EUKA|nr:hypothetical protein J8273_3485 [Carpediemonas membranifera]|eukprot:KAG9393350.1 hypothetical protein J8273_3485 [Carpediemonas membranifera]
MHCLAFTCSYYSSVIHATLFAVGTVVAVLGTALWLSVKTVVSLSKTESIISAAILCSFVPFCVILIHIASRYLWARGFEHMVRSLTQGPTTFDDWVLLMPPPDIHVTVLSHAAGIVVLLCVAQLIPIAGSIVVFIISSISLSVIWVAMVFSPQLSISATVEAACSALLYNPLYAVVICLVNIVEPLIILVPFAGLMFSPFAHSLTIVISCRILGMTIVDVRGTGEDTMADGDNSAQPPAEHSDAPWASTDEITVNPTEFTPLLV